MNPINIFQVVVARRFRRLTLEAESVRISCRAVGSSGRLTGREEQKKSGRRAKGKKKKKKKKEVEVILDGIQLTCPVDWLKEIPFTAAIRGSRRINPHSALLH